MPNPLNKYHSKTQPPPIPKSTTNPATNPAPKPKPGWEHDSQLIYLDNTLALMYHVSSKQWYWQDNSGYGDMFTDFYASKNEAERARSHGLGHWGVWVEPIIQKSIPKPKYSKEDVELAIAYALRCFCQYDCYGPNRIPMDTIKPDNDAADALCRLQAQVYLTKCGFGQQQ